MNFYAVIQTNLTLEKLCLDGETNAERGITFENNIVRISKVKEQGYQSKQVYLDILSGLLKIPLSDSDGWDVIDTLVVKQITDETIDSLNVQPPKIKAANAYPILFELERMYGGKDCRLKFDSFSIYLDGHEVDPKTCSAANILDKYTRFIKKYQEFHEISCLGKPIMEQMYNAELKEKQICGSEAGENNWSGNNLINLQGFEDHLKKIYGHRFHEMMRKGRTLKPISVFEQVELFDELEERFDELERGVNNVEQDIPEIDLSDVIEIGGPFLPPPLSSSQPKYDDPALWKNESAELQESEDDEIRYKPLSKKELKNLKSCRGVEVLGKRHDGIVLGIKKGIFIVLSQKESVL